MNRILFAIVVLSSTACVAPRPRAKERAFEVEGVQVDARTEPRSARLAALQVERPRQLHL